MPTIINPRRYELHDLAPGGRGRSRYDFQGAPALLGRVQRFASAKQWKSDILNAYSRNYRTHTRHPVNRFDSAMGSIRGGSSRPAISFADLPSSSMPGFLEMQFRKLTKSRQPFQELSREASYWRGLGASVANWIIHRAEGVNDVAQAAILGAMLAAIKPAPLDLILESLRNAPSESAADVLLDALRLLGEALSADQAERMAATIRLYLSDTDPIIRSKAVQALESLPAALAVPLLNGALRYEQDDDVRADIGYALELRRQ